MDEGWIQLHRKIRKSDMWRSLNSVQRDVTISLLLMASYKENRWEYAGEIYEVKPGQVVTSLKSIQEECGKGVTIQNVRTALDKLKKWGFLTWESTNKNRLVTITNWEVYQGSNKETNKQDNKEGNKQTDEEDNKQSGQKKKDGQKPSKKEPINNYDTEFEELWQDYPNKKGKAKARTSYKKHRKDGVSAEDFRSALERYKKEIKVKETPQQYIKHGSTFFHSGFEDYLEDNDSGDTVQVEPQRLEMPTMDFLQQQLEKAMGNLE